MGAGASTATPAAVPVANATLPFPKDGVKLSAVKDFFVACGDRDKLNGLTTNDVCEKFVKPLSAAGQQSFCDMLRSQNHPAVGLATVFISHAWKYMFLDVVDSLLQHFTSEPDIVIWFDLFSNNQHKAVDLNFDWWCNTFKSAIQQFGRTVMVLSPWNDPVPLTRAWCLFEIYSTLDTKSKFEVALSADQRTAFIQDMEENGNNAIDKMLATIDTERSECFKPEDKAKIFDFVRKTLGFQVINSVVFTQMRTWVVSAATESLKNVMDDKTRIPYLNILGKLYTELGQFALAEPVLNDALNKSKSVLGETNPITLDTMINLAILYEKEDKFDVAEPMLLSALDKKKATLKPDDATLLNNTHQIANIYQDRGKYDAAEPLYTQVIAFRTTKLGAHHPDTLAATTDLATMYKMWGKYDKAEPLLISCVDLNKTNLGIDHPTTLLSQNNLAALYDEQSKFEISEPILVEVLETRKERLGENHPDTSDSLYNLGIHHHNRGNFDQAKVLVQNCVDIRKTALGLSHPDTVTAVQSLQNITNKAAKITEKSEVE